ncbi:hypothetical protein C8Q75DRAFT_806506 [Abortiporus biennis]|nr:hypothetical protein C8Q75DRAFT_806506 [Abortiporus biennis]
MPWIAHCLLLLSLVYDRTLAQSAQVPRWGQAVALLQDTLYVQGGRTDQFNSFSYTAAPVSNDLFSLSLSSSFSSVSPSWDILSSCSNCSSNQGPEVAWHTFSAFNTSTLLLFGGDPGPNAPIVLPERNDSAVLLDVTNRQDPLWDLESDSWASQPLRRMYHTASSAQGRIWIVGGLKTDGSNAAFSQHYVFDPHIPSFNELASANGPPDIFGHASVVLSNGKLLVFGGYSPSMQTLFPFSTVWVLDTTETNSQWSTVTVSNNRLPTPRRGFASTLLDGGKVLIQGGGDAALQTIYSDGWILDTTQSPMTWSSVAALSSLGPRIDHFAVSVGTTVIFGFGYSNTGAAPTTLSILDTTSFQFVSSYSPPSPGTFSSATTLPSSTQTSTPGSPHSESEHPSSPTSTSGGISPTSTSGVNPTLGVDPSGADGTSNTLAITLGTVFGVIGLLIGTTVVTYYLRKQRSQSFQLLSPSSDNEDSAHLVSAIPIAGGIGSRNDHTYLPPVMKNVKDRLSTFVAGISGAGPVSQQERRDMLAEEDTREFDPDDWYGRSGSATGIRRGASSGQSSWKSIMRPTALTDRVYESINSLRNVGGAMLGRRRDASGGSRSTWKTEKEPSDPFADDWALIRPVAYSKVASIPVDRHGSSATYADPYEDYEVESLNADAELGYRDDDELKGGYYPYASLSDPPPLPKLKPVLPAATATMDLTRLTPVSEQPSVSSMTVNNNSNSDSSHSASASSTPQFATFAATSSTSHEQPRSPRRPSSILDPHPQPSAPMRRSDSWWSRFAKTPLLDRRASDASRKSQIPLDFRDPNPPPSRLIPIEESISPDSPVHKSGESSGTGHGQMYSTRSHARSASSLQTSRTANSEMLEKMGRTMDIIQKESTMSSHLTNASGSGDEPPSISNGAHRHTLSIITSSGSNSSDTPPPGLVMSPEELSEEWKDIILHSPPSSRPPSGDRGNVASRVQAIERRISEYQVVDGPSPGRNGLRSPPPARSRQHVSVYGIAPKPSLFIANPDHRLSGSGDS